MKTKEEILEKHLIPMLNREKGSFKKIEQMRGLPEWNVVIDAMEEYAKIKLSERQQQPVPEKAPESALRIADVVCCGVLEKMNLGWMKLEDGTKCMPYIKGHSDEIMYRVNNCPSCGKYIRDVMI